MPTWPPQHPVVPCRGGAIQPVDLTTGTAGTPIAGVNGPPILADGGLWAADHGTSSLYELSPSSGPKLQTLSTGSPVPTFGSSSAGDGLVLIGTTTGVTAFAGPGGPPPAAPAAPDDTPYVITDAAGTVHAFGGAPYEGSHSGPLAKPVVGIASTPDHGGYWLVAADGSGYWMVGSDGGVFALGDSTFAGPLGGASSPAPVVGITTG
jgi:outer membrane protein assembly factor BamB